MAIAFCRAQILGRSAGRSAVACAAYRAGEKLQDQRYGKIQDYEHRSGVLASGIMTPKDAPEWMQDREQLWNAVERREDRSNRPDQAQLAREFVVALPHELDDEHRLFIIRNIGKEATRMGMVVDYAIHEPDAEGDNRNYHAHLMVTMREIDVHDPDGFGGKERDWNSKKELAAFKAMTERETNKMLERQGIAEKISFEWEEGHEGQKHKGVAATALERAGVETRIGQENAAIQERNEQRQQIKEELASLDRQEAVLNIAPERVANRSFEDFAQRQTERKANPTRNYSPLHETHAQVAEQLRQERHATASPESEPPAQEYPKRGAIIQDEPIRSRAEQATAPEREEEIGINPEVLAEIRRRMEAEQERERERTRER